jgi:predicted nucleic acid-binding Zn ribbon protein
MSHRQPQHIGDVLSQLLARRGYARERSAGACTEAWKTAVGDQLASSTKATAIRRGVLEVLVKNSTLVQEMNFQKRDLIARLAQLLPDENIRELKFRVGPVT